MFQKLPSWESITPEELLPSVEHIRKEFDRSHWKCSSITEKLCHADLHPGDAAAKTVAAEYAPAFSLYCRIIGPQAQSEFDELLRAGTPPSIFKAYFDAFCKGMQGEVQRVFGEVLQIGLASRRRLGLHPIEWAKTHVNIMISSKSRVVGLWVKSVCDKQEHPRHLETDNEIREHLFWTTWRAPKLVYMQPAGPNFPYEPDKAWTREDERRTLVLLAGLSSKLSETLEFELESSAGDAHVWLAKGERSDGVGSLMDRNQEEASAHETRIRQSLVYPREFSRQARALVEAQKLRGRMELAEQRKLTPWLKYATSSTDEENLRKYILRVWLVFTSEACKLAEQVVWSVDEVRSQSDEFLRLFTIEAHYHDGHDKEGRKLPEMVSHWNGHLLDKVRRDFEKSPEWSTFAAALLRVAEQIGRQGLAEKTPRQSQEQWANGEVSQLAENGDVKAGRARSPFSLNYRSEVKRAISHQLVKNPRASDLDVCRGLDADGAIELPDEWNTGGNRLFVKAYVDETIRRKIEVAISKVRTDMREKGLIG